KYVSLECRKLSSVIYPSFVSFINDMCLVDVVI
ncbi:Hypothetical protein EIN_458040, partial [Entamoeba invadens IP1]